MKVMKKSSLFPINPYYMSTKKTQVVYRDAIKGTFCTPEYAKKHPRTTEKEHR